LSLIGGVIGAFIFNSVATPAPGCIVPGSDACLEAFGLTFVSFIVATAAIGGAIGLGIQFAKGERA
jgi:hypothetical protein